MKTLLSFTILLSLLLVGCATSHIATDIGQDIGQSYSKSAKKGLPTADEIQKAWPYISGLIKGLTGEDFDYHMSQSLKFVISSLDKLCAKKEPLTDEEKGLIVGYVVRLEGLAGREFWDKYGSGLFDKIKLVAGGLL